ncbi:hypothetical protein D3C81_1979970 [compost metagenome]
MLNRQGRNKSLILGQLQPGTTVFNIRAHQHIDDRFLVQGTRAGLTIDQQHPKLAFRDLRVDPHSCNQPGTCREIVIKLAME